MNNSDIKLSAESMTDIGFNQHLGSGDKAWIFPLSNVSLVLVHLTSGCYSASIHKGTSVIASQPVSTLEELETFINQTIKQFLWTSM